LGTTRAVDTLINIVAIHPVTIIPSWARITDIAFAGRGHIGANHTLKTGFGCTTIDVRTIFTITFIPHGAVTTAESFAGRGHIGANDTRKAGLACTPINVRAVAPISFVASLANTLKGAGEVIATGLDVTVICTFSAFIHIHAGTIRSKLIPRITRLTGLTRIED
tara:strand:- start:1714 stop:2208 length:495 start_codon:yes stop_codon:yes gene_type:complete